MREIAKKEDFRWFVYNIFSACFLNSPSGFIGGDYIDDVCKHIDDNDFTMDISGRDHFKSTRLYADIMYRLIKEKDTGFEAWYFSFSQKFATYHIGKIKEMIRSNPYYDDIHDLKPTAEGVISYTWDDPHKVVNPRKMTVRPSGLLSFKRGIHAEHIYVDDPFQDESDKKLDAANIIKINTIMKSNIISMVKPGGTCRVVGTPQTEHDFFFDESMQAKFTHWIKPAVVDEHNKVALWPEWKTYDELMALKKLLGDRIFSKEYMATPVSAVDSYIDRQKLYSLATAEQLDFGHHLEFNNELVYAGFDIGQKVHPAHLAVWLRKIEYNDNNEQVVKWTQLYQKFMDHWQYTKQIEFLNAAIEFFNIEVLRYDNTRAEFMGFAEQGILSDRMEPWTLNSKNEASLAANFGTIVDTERAAFINDQRQLNQILAVNNDLKAIPGPEGHGDSFWSNALAMYEEPDKSPSVRWL